MSHELVILVHGHAGHPLVMLPIQRYLERRDFKVLNWTYFSVRGSVATHAAELAKKSAEMASNPEVSQIHFVGHSMGAILVRWVLEKQKPPKVGRIVLLAPPNRGARLADFIKIFMGKRILAAEEMSQDPESLVNRLSPRALGETGIIAASLDSVVPLSSTHLEGEKDHLILNSLHDLPLHRKVPAQIEHFITHGFFSRTRRS